MRFLAFLTTPLAAVAAAAALVLARTDVDRYAPPSAPPGFFRDEHEDRPPLLPLTALATAPPNAVLAAVWRRGLRLDGGRAPPPDEAWALRARAERLRALLRAHPREIAEVRRLLGALDDDGDAPEGPGLSRRMDR